MTALSHLDPMFSSVYSIEAVNGKKPVVLMNSLLTKSMQSRSWTPPRLRTTAHVSVIRHAVAGAPLTLAPTVQKNFVKTVRAIELILGIPVPGAKLSAQITTSNLTAAITLVTRNTTSDIFNNEVKAALNDAAPILLQIGIKLAISSIFNFGAASPPSHSKRTPLVTTCVVKLLSVNLWY